MKTYSLGKSSMERLSTCNIEIVSIVLEAIKHSTIDFGIPQDGGRRTAERQNELFLKKASTKDGYKKLSKHQSGDAFDIVAYVPELGGYSYEEHLYLMLAGHIKATAKRLGYELRWGGDWDGDNDRKDQTFNDLCHFELVRK